MWCFTRQDLLGQPKRKLIRIHLLLRVRNELVPPPLVQVPCIVSHLCLPPPMLFAFLLLLLPLSCLLCLPLSLLLSHRRFFLLSLAFLFQCQQPLYLPVQRFFIFGARHVPLPLSLLLRPSNNREFFLEF